MRGTLFCTNALQATFDVCVRLSPLTVHGMELNLFMPQQLSLRAVQLVMSEAFKGLEQ